MPAAVDRAFAILIAALIVVFGFFPWANWIGGGFEAEWYTIVLDDWRNGTMIVVGAGVALAILSRHIPFLWRTGTLAFLMAAPIVVLGFFRDDWLTGIVIVLGAGVAMAILSRRIPSAWRPGTEALLGFYDRRPMVISAAISVVSLLAYLTLALVIFDGQPLLIDEIVQVFQGRTFASGQITREAFAYPEFFSGMHLIDDGGRVYGQFPAGGPAMLALGSLLGAEWLVGPVAGALTVFAFGWLAQRLDPAPGVRLGATILLAFAPFTLFMAASHMNHVTSLLWLVVAMGCLAVVTQEDHPQPWAALGCGLGLGIAATIRPADALAFALPAGLWLLVRTTRHPRSWPNLLLSGVGVAIPVAGLMWVNANTTGHPLLFGYTVLWGESHALGFHVAPWGDIHTPLRGLELINLYWLRLQTYLFETSLPSLLPVVLALLLCRSFRPFDRYLLVSGSIVVGLYFAYWHDGFYLGPRFMYPLIPVLVLWTARLPGIVRTRFGEGVPYRTVVFGYAVAAILAIAVNGPLRGRQYVHGMLTPRWDADAGAAAAGVHDALILVRESWGAQILALMWARGVNRSEAEVLYRKIDSCILYEQMAALEKQGVEGPEAAAALRPFLRDSAAVIESPHSPDYTERYLPGYPYSDPCRTRIREDGRGFTLYPLLAGANNNVFARDLHARDTTLLAAFPNRPVYLLKPEDPSVGSPKRFYPVSVDSLRQVWATPPPR